MPTWEPSGSSTSSAGRLGLTPDAAVLVATVRALKAHSGKYRIVAGKALPPELLEENPDDVLAGAANLAKQIENVKAHGVTPVVAINGFPTDHASEHDAIRQVADRGRCAGGGVHAFQRRRHGRDGSRPCRCRGVRGAEQLPLPLQGQRHAQAEDREGCDRDLRRRARRVHARRQQATQELRGQRLRQAAGVHRQDPPLDLRRRQPQGCADRSHVDGPRSRGRRSAPGSCIRSAARCARCQGSARRRQRRSSTSTRTARSSACHEQRLRTHSGAGRS